jgi:hypothetical protein
MARMPDSSAGRGASAVNWVPAGDRRQLRARRLRSVPVWLKQRRLAGEAMALPQPLLCHAV